MQDKTIYKLSSKKGALKIEVKSISNKHIARLISAILGSE